jgi:hypothetical protein
MPKTAEMHSGKYLTKEDVGRGILVTVKSVVKRNVGLDDENPELKWCLILHEVDKPFILNVTNIDHCEEILGSDDTDQWLGKRLVLFIDPNVLYAGKRVGGIRVRAPKPGAVPPPPPVVTELDESEPPF